MVKINRMEIGMNIQFGFLLYFGISTLLNICEEIYKKNLMDYKQIFYCCFTLVYAFLMIASFVTYKMKKKVCFQLGKLSCSLAIFYYLMIAFLELRSFDWFTCIVLGAYLLLFTFSIWNIHHKQEYMF